jgi:hypothetical protein
MHGPDFFRLRPVLLFVLPILLARASQDILRVQQIGHPAAVSWVFFHEKCRRVDIFFSNKALSCRHVLLMSPGIRYENIVRMRNEFAGRTLESRCTTRSKALALNIWMTIEEQRDDRPYSRSN